MLSVGIPARAQKAGRLVRYGPPLVDARDPPDGRLLPAHGQERPGRSDVQKTQGPHRRDAGKELLKDAQRLRSFFGSRRRRRQRVLVGLRPAQALSEKRLPPHRPRRRGRCDARVHGSQMRRRLRSVEREPRRRLQSHGVRPGQCECGIPARTRGRRREYDGEETRLRKRRRRLQRPRRKRRTRPRGRRGPHRRLHARRIQSTPALTHRHRRRQSLENHHRRQPLLLRTSLQNKPHHRRRPNLQARQRQAQSTRRHLEPPLIYLPTRRLPPICLLFLLPIRLFTSFRLLPCFLPDFLRRVCPQFSLWRHDETTRPRKKERDPSF
mmetsp:Transcript_37506/g.120315  ORF Transcript_37506/g.120315 Transcript_37506/m.120315 type:complete len:324 (+) Transcript_37506:2203-3174(+)